VSLIEELNTLTLALGQNEHKKNDEGPTSKNGHEPWCTTTNLTHAFSYGELKANECIQISMYRWMVEMVYQYMEI
jgi:hypothetical protein